MTHTPSNATHIMALSADDILAYLRDHPNFLQQHPEAADLLAPAKSGGQGVADFQSYMIDRLKSDKDAMEQATREIVETARYNMNNHQRIEAAVLRILEAETFDDFLHSITLDLPNRLGVDICTFIIEAQGGTIPHIQSSGLRMVPEGTLSKWMGGELVLMQDNICGIEAIYGGAANLVQSQLLLRIDVSLNTTPAILAFGSRQSDMFTPDQATDQISFLAGVIERAFRTWIKLLGLTH